MASRHFPASLIVPATLAAACLCVVLMTPAAGAQPRDPRSDPLADATLLTLSESAERDVTPDTMRARLTAQATAETAAAAQNTVNAAMTRALAVVRAVGLEVETGGYNTFQEMPPRPSSLPAGGKPPAPVWRAQQNLTITATDSDRLLATAGELQKEGLLLQELGFVVSRAQQRSRQDEMTTEALQRLTARAEQAAAALGLRFDGWHRVGLNGGVAPRPMMKAAMAAPLRQDFAPPVAAAGEQTLTVSVDGEAILRRR